MIYIIIALCHVVIKMKKILIISIKIFFVLTLLFISILYYETKMLEWNIKEIILDRNLNTSNTKFIFIFDDHNKTVYDKTNAVQKIYGIDNDDINMALLDSSRIIIFKESGILKTDNDSIDVQDTYVKLGGYMGIWDKEHREFYVDKKGIFQIKN